MPNASPQVFDVTYKEVMQLWNLSTLCAKRRLNTIRLGLGKKRKHKLTVTQFCQEEDITPQEFYNQINL